MPLLLVVHPWELHRVKCHLLPFCWFFDAGVGFVAEGRDDGLIYRAGFRTREAAEEWAKREGMMD